MNATALYDFEGDVSQGELCLTAGQPVIVRKQDIGEGWWEGEAGGKVGLFPASYVELTDAAGGHDAAFDDDVDDWDSADDWDEEDEDDGMGGGGGGDAGAHAMSSMSHARPTSTYEFSSSGTGGAASDMRAGTLKKSVNRFSAFVKAGAEAFLLGMTRDNTIDPQDVLHIMMADNSLIWANQPQGFGDVSVAHDGSRSKYKGIKSFEAYIVSHQGQQVERRYKHFAWLHERLVDKYSCICVPPLPGKDHLSRFGESFIDKRQQRLQAWLSRIARHPVLSHDSLALPHFMQCSTSDKQAWKAGKRKAEKDPFVGAQFFRLVSQDVDCPRDSDQSIEQFGSFVKDMDKTVKKNADIALQHADRMHTHFNREYKKIASGFEQLGQTFANGGGQVNGDSVRLSGAYVTAAQKLTEIGDMWGDQPKNDQLPFVEALKEYHALLPRFNDSITSSKSASVRVEEIENNDVANPQERDAVRTRCDIIHSVTLCEMAHFHAERRRDFRDMMQAYLQAKIDFHERLIAKYREAKQAFDDLNY